MSKTDKLYSWIGMTLCLFMIVFQDKFLRQANPYDVIFYSIMFVVIATVRLWHWLRDKVQMKE